MADTFNIPNQLQLPSQVIPLAEFQAGVRIVTKTAPTPDSGFKTSALGTPVVSNLSIKAGNYTDIYGSVIYYPDVFANNNNQNFDVDTVLFNINQSRNIIKTPIQGLDGTVKEYISDGDYIINIKGVIQGANGVYPTQDVENLISICQAKCALTIFSDYLQILGITNIVIENYSLPQEMGSQSQQVFELNCLSDVNYLIFEQQ
jgi:hypothetical protein